MMNPLYNVCNSMRRSTGFVLMAAALSLGAISGCGSNNNNSRGSDGGLEAVDPNAGIYPSIQVIQPFLSGAVDPIKVQYWDQTYYWGPDSDGNDACFKGTVGIEVSPDLAQETLSGQVCPTSTDPVDGKTSLGQVAPCNPDATPGEPYEVASGAVQPAIAGCEQGGAPCTDILVPDITDEVTCESMVRMADPIAAGAAWFQNIDAPGTKGGEASHWWYGTRAGKSFDAEDGYGGTQIDYISDATNINIVATGGGSDDPGINNIYLCSDKDVVNPAENPDVCTLSSLFGSCDKGDLKECKINNIGLVDGAYNIYIRSATPSNGSGGDIGEPSANSNITGDVSDGSCASGAAPSLCSSDNNPNSCTGVGGDCRGSADLASCAQPPFPYYYYNKFSIAQTGKDMVRDQGTIDSLMNEAKTICNASDAQSWEGLGSPIAVNLTQIASIYKNAANLYSKSMVDAEGVSVSWPGGDAASDSDCAAAIIVAMGECSHAGGGQGGKDDECSQSADQTNPWPNAIWQNMNPLTEKQICPGGAGGEGGACNPDQSAHGLFEGTGSLPVKCFGPNGNGHVAPDTIGISLVNNKIYMSDGNDNKIGQICHVSNLDDVNPGAFAWGGGSCSGGSAPAPGCKITTAYYPPKAGKPDWYQCMPCQEGNATAYTDSSCLMLAPSNRQCGMPKPGGPEVGYYCKDKGTE